MNEKKRFHFSKKFIIALIIFFVIIVASCYVIITKSGYWLIHDDSFNHVKWAVILDGQTADLERNDYVAKLMQDGKVDSVLILGRRILRDKSNASFYAEDFIRLGKFDKQAIFIAPHDDPSTITEARTIIPWFKSRGTDSILIITSTPASRRAHRLFSALAGNQPFILTANIHNYQYNPDSWIFNRESRKLWLHEMAAFANSFLDLWGVQELTAADSAYFKPIHSIAEEETESMVDLQTLIPQVDQRIDSLKKASQADSTTSDSAGINSSTGSSK